jgi:tripartite-type tricarboxylate transporter receptor subunit TctC
LFLVEVGAAIRLASTTVPGFDAQGAEPYITGPEEFAAILKADIEKWTGVVKASGAQVD